MLSSSFSTYFCIAWGNEAPEPLYRQKFLKSASVHTLQGSAAAPTTAARQRRTRSATCFWRRLTPVIGRRVARCVDASRDALAEHLCTVPPDWSHRCTVCDTGCPVMTWTWRDITWSTLQTAGIVLLSAADNLRAVRWSWRRAAGHVTTKGGHRLGARWTAVDDGATVPTTTWRVLGFSHDELRAVPRITPTNFDGAWRAMPKHAGRVDDDDGGGGIDISVTSSADASDIRRTITLHVDEVGFPMERKRTQDQTERYSNNVWSGLTMSVAWNILALRCLDYPMDSWNRTVANGLSKHRLPCQTEFGHHDH